MKRWLPVLFLVLFRVAAAQSVAALEEEFFTLQRQIETVQGGLDSLNASLEQQAGQIDAEKRRESPDREKLRRQMAAGLALSKQIEERQKRLQTLQKNRTQTQYRLAQRYAAMLDSLQALQAGAATANPELDQQIVRCTEQYLLYSPVFRALSFDPQKIREINPAESSDSLERALSLNYLRNALAEMESHLQEIRKNREEVENTLRLEHKTRQFLEEVDADNLGLLARAGNPAATEMLAPNSEPGLSAQAGVGRTLAAQVESITLFFNQLGVRDLEGISLSRFSAAPAGRAPLSLEEYLALLQAAEKQLKQIRNAARQKLREAGAGG